MFDLTGKVALVTGATGGIGAAIARALHAQGATVALSGTREAVLTELKGELGDRAEVFVADLADRASVDALVPAVEGKFGRPLNGQTVGLLFLTNAGRPFGCFTVKEDRPALLEECEEGLSV